MNTPEDLVRTLTESGLTVATAESLTGGMLCSELVSVPGASAAVLGGIVSYATQVKIDQLGVPEEVVARDGVVSAPCAEAMARGVRARLGADVGISTTGVAGPDTQDGQPVGTVFVAVAFDGPSGEECRVHRAALTGDRAEIRRAACSTAIELASSTLLGHPAREQTLLG